MLKRFKETKKKKLQKKTPKRKYSMRNYNGYKKDSRTNDKQTVSTTATGDSQKKIENEGDY